MPWNISVVAPPSLLSENGNLVLMVNSGNDLVLRINGTDAAGLALLAEQTAETKASLSSVLALLANDNLGKFEFYENLYVTTAQ
jgi:hypothetical protein